jgi:hypothetical protein
MGSCGTHAALREGDEEGMGSSLEEMVQRGGSGKNGRWLGAERSSSLGTQTVEAARRSSDVRPGDGTSKQVRNALAPVIGVLKGG